ncbi:MAG: DUF2061 domain-containing protein [Saprospiraceae bacterium]|nr:DUF2061 domain-containing protein [Saprospiraceae bacterium]
MSKQSTREGKKRSVIKAITYRASATIATFTLAYAFTGSLEIAGQIGVLDFVIKFLIYYINERLWTKTNWGYQDKTTIKTTDQNDYLSQRQSASQSIASLEH